jgi:organic radical activating enzyme
MSKIKIAELFYSIQGEGMKVVEHIVEITE